MTIIEGTATNQREALALLKEASDAYYNGKYKMFGHRTGAICSLCRKNNTEVATYGYNEVRLIINGYQELTLPVNCHDRVVCLDPDCWYGNPEPKDT